MFCINDNAELQSEYRILLTSLSKESAVMKQFFILLFIGIFLIIANEGLAAEKKTTWVFDYRNALRQRPANFYRLAESTNKPFCEQVLSKLNEPYTASDSSYFNLLTYNSASLIWEEISKGPIYKVEHGNKNKLYIYKRYWTVSGFYLAVINILDTPIPTSEKDKSTFLNKQHKINDFYIEPKKRRGLNILPIIDSEINILSLGEKEGLIVLHGEGGMNEHICGGYFHLYAQSYPDIANDKTPNNLCHFISIPKIECIIPLLDAVE